MACASEGDTVVLYASADAAVLATLAAGKTQSVGGHPCPHSLAIGARYGTRILSFGNSGGGGGVHLLRLTPELWARVLPHRTQVLYGADIGHVVFALGVAPGSVVVECGTGSGALTYALARACGPSGAVYTFDFHAERAAAARATFDALFRAGGGGGGAARVVVSHADAYADGFCAPQSQPPVDLTGRADAAFLDLPEPARAVEHAWRVLRPGAPLCSFSPCVEQVKDTYRALAHECRFHNVRTVECLERPFDLRRVNLPRLNAEVLSSGGGGGGKRSREERPSTSKEERPFLSQPTANIRGHTGFLTYAWKAIHAPAEPAATAETVEAPTESV